MMCGNDRGRRGHWIADKGRSQFLEPKEEQLENRRVVGLAVTNGQIDRRRFIWNRANLADSTRAAARGN
jgi:hypothetical protein